MKHSILVFRFVTPLSAALALCANAPAQSIVWTNGASNATINWSDPLNWQGGAIPGAANAVLFDNNPNMATAAGSANVDNIANQNFLVDGLIYSETNGFHNTLINPGVTLTVSNNAAAELLLSGTETDAGSTGNLYNSIFGAGGTLALYSANSNSTVIIRQGTATTSTSPMSTVDLSGLDNFDLTVGQVQIAVKGPVDHAGGTLILAKTNFIQATTEAVTTTTGPSGAIEIYDSSANTGNAEASKGIMQLGITNGIFADVITVGRSKSPSGTELIFNPNFAGNNPTAYFRGYNSNRVTAFLVADDTGISSSAACNALADLSGGASDLMVNTFVVGNGQTSTGTGTITAVFNMGAGNLNVNNLYIGYQNSTAAAETMNCTFNLENGGNVLVNSNLYLGHYLGGTKHSTPTLNMTSGSLTSPNGIVDLTGNSSSTMSLANCTVTAPSIGTSSANLGHLTIGDSTLNLAVNGLSGAVFTANLATDSATNGNIINITSISGVGSSTVITLIQSATQIQNQSGFNGGQLDFVLGTLPNGMIGTLQSGENGMAVQLVLTRTAMTNNWTGADIAAHNNTNWSDGLNWSLGVEPGSGSIASFLTSGSVAASALSALGGGPAAIDLSKINNLVNGNVTVQALTYDNTNGTYQNTFIANNTTLTVSSGGLTVGNPGADLGNTTGNVTITGGGGTLNLSSNGAEMYIGLGDASPSSIAKATLDMSGLGAFDASVLNFLVGVGGYSSGTTTVLQPLGTVYLAQTNVITASSSVNDTSDFISLALEVGDAGDNEILAGYGNTAGSALYLGLVNSISADYIDVGRQWASGGIYFNPAVTNANPTVTFGGVSAGAVAKWSIGDGVESSLDGGGGSGTNDFSGGTVHALVNTLQIGVASPGSYNVVPETGILTFNAGNITANTVNISYNPAYSDGNYYNYGVGTVNVNGAAALAVTGSLNLASFAGGTSSSSVYGAPAATLNINGGSVLANIIVPGAFGATAPGANGAATSIINVNGGLLAATNGIGTALAPLTSLNLTNATIYAGASAVPLIYAENVMADGSSASTNSLHILSLPPIEHYPSTVALLKSATPIILAGGVFNFQVTFPQGSTYAGSLSESGDSTTIQLTLTGGPIGSRGIVLWDGPDGTNMNWSDASNWLLPGTPGLGDTAYFDNTGKSFSPGAGSVDNIVDTNVLVASLIYSETNGFHNTVINPGVTLTVSNNTAATLLLSGTETDAGSSAKVYNTISGNGTLTVYDTNTASTAVICQGSSSTTSSPLSTLDLSDLDNFNLTVGQLQIAVYGTPSDVDHPGGALILAATNFIQATTEAVTTGGGASGAIEIYDGSNNNDGADQSKGVMELGMTNGIFADAITVGRSKSPSGTQLIFNPNLAGNNPTAYFRGYNSNRVTEFLIADDSPVSSGVACVGLVDLSEGTSDLMINTLVIGNGQTSTGAGPITATFNMGAGNLNVNNLNIGYQNSTAAAEPMTCALNLANGGNLVVNSNLLLGYHPGGTVYPSAALNVSGGSLTARNIADQSGNSSSAVTLANCTVSLTTLAGSIGTVAQPIGSITLNDTILNLALGGSAAVVTGALTVNGSSDTINVTDMPLTAKVPVTNTVIQSMAPINGYDFVLGTLPAGYAGYLQENAAGTAVQLVITTAPNPASGAKITSVNLQKATESFVISGANGPAGSDYYVLTSTNLALPLSSWTAIATNAFDAGGNFSVALPYAAGNAAAFYVIKSQ